MGQGESCSVTNSIQVWSFRHFHSPHISHAPAVSTLNKHHSEHTNPGYMKHFFLLYYFWRCSIPCTNSFLVAPTTLAQGWGREGMKDMGYASQNLILNWRNITCFLTCFYITLAFRQKNIHIDSWQCWIWLESLVLLWNTKREVATVCATLNALASHFPLCLEWIRDLPEGHGKVLFQVHQNAQEQGSRLYSNRIWCFCTPL